MNKLKKSLSILLTLVMLFTTFCFFVIPETGIEANATAGDAVTVTGVANSTYNRVDDVIICVPETIYMTPSTGESITGQYYVNNVVDSSGKVNLAAEYADTTGQISIYAPGATSMSINVVKDIGTIGEPMIGNAATSTATPYENTTYAMTDGYFSFDGLYLYLDGTGLSTGVAASIKWEVTLTYSTGTVTYYAYSVLYSPWYQPVGAAAKAKGSYHDTFASSILWVSGVHGYTAGDSGNLYYVQTAKFLPMLGTIQTPSNNSPDTHWIQSDSNGLSATVSYYSVEASGTKYHARANSISPTATLTVDTSRYNNFNQIPNFKIGFMITDRDGTNSSGTNQWYISDYGTTAGSSYYNGTATGSSQYTSDYNDAGTSFKSGSSDTTSEVKYNDAWNKAITGTASFRIKSAVESMYKAGITTTGWNNNFVNISVTGVDKSELRNLVLQATSIDKTNYLSNVWDYFDQDIQTAAYVLGNPCATADDVSTAITRLKYSINGCTAGQHPASSSWVVPGLQVKATFNGNGGTAGISSRTFTVGTAISEPIPADATATRTGYTFKGWSTSTSVDDIVSEISIYDTTVGSVTYYAIWEANAYKLTFDNLFDFSTFTINEAELTIDERTDTGFTVTSTNGSDANTGFSKVIPVTPGKTYILSADVTFTQAAGDTKGYDIYVHTLDENQTGETTAIPDTSNGAGREGNVYISLTHQTTETKPYVRFTAGENTAYIKIRFDANTAGNTLTVNNIRVYEEGTVADGVSYHNPVTATYDSTYSLPTPTRAGYTFGGWYDASGIVYKTGSKVTITSDKNLYSTWTVNNYTITLDYNGGGTNTAVAYTIEDTSFQLPTPERAGYSFDGWVVSKADAEGTWAVGDIVADGTLDKDYGNVTIQAQWTQLTYKITWVDHDGTVLETDENVIWGTVPTYDGEAPTRDGGAEFTYTFTGWGEITKAYENKTYTAQYSSVVNEYTVIWQDYDGTTLETDNNVPYGETPSYDGATPARKATAQYTYTFSGWSPEVSEVTGNVTYTATYTETVNTYTVTWIYQDGTVLEKDENVPYGETPSYDGEEPTLAEREGYTVKFNGWSPEVSEVTGNVTYTAQLEYVINTYNVTIKYRTSTGEEKTVEYTDVEHFTSFEELLPTDFANAYYTSDTTMDGIHYEAEWNKEVTEITESCDFVAGYAEKTHSKIIDDENTYSATCTANGSEGYKCSVCSYAEATTILAFNHTKDGVSQWVEISNTATCTAGGTKTSKCNLCGTTSTGASNAKGHSFDTTVAREEATCTENGHAAYKYCPSCKCYFAENATAYATNGVNSNEGFIISATGHSFTLTQANAATCEATGNDAYNYCASCKLYFAADATGYDTNGAADNSAFITPELGHDYESVVTAPKCEEQGYTTHTCKREGCSSSYVDSYVAATGHTPGEPVQENIQGATCTEPGSYEQVVYCTADGCDYEFSRDTVITTLPHKYIEKLTGDTNQLVSEKTCTAYAVYYMACSECNTLSTETFNYTEGGLADHTPGDVAVEAYVAGTCTTEATWYDVTYCTECKQQTSKESITGAKDATNHADYGTYTNKEDVTPGTCIAEETWNDVTYCSGCNVELNTEAKTGNKNIRNHVGTTTVVNENIVNGTCISAKTWNEVTYCESCSGKVSTVKRTGEIDASNHEGEKYTEDENVVLGTCVTAKTWDKVEYCADCNQKTGNVTAMTGETDEANHSTYATSTNKEDIVPGTCKTAGTWKLVTRCTKCNETLESVTETGSTNASNHEGTTELRYEKSATCKEDGYTGDLYWACCDTLYAEGTVISKNENHIGGTPVRENEVNATETTDGSYDSVVYCTVCGKELSRQTVVFRLEREIRFILKDSTIIVKAYNGDIVALPDVPAYTSADGFVHMFIGWDKSVTVVTGDATYTALYTEPCDYSELERLEQILDEIENGDVVDSTIVATYQDEIDALRAEIEEVKKDKNYRDVSEQDEITAVTDKLDVFIEKIYPDAGSVLVINGSSVQYVGGVIDVKAVKMPTGKEVTDAEWTSSDDSIIFWSNGQLYAVGTGTVTLTATRGKLTASKTITIIDGGNTRGINFTTIDKTHFIVEDYKAVYDSEIIYWSDDQELRFRVRVYQSFMFEDYIVYINGNEAEVNEQGYYVIPAGSGDVRVTIAGAMIDTGAGEGEVVTKWSFWEWLLAFFRKIADFFTNLF